MVVNNPLIRPSYLVGGWTNPSEKYYHFPRVGSCHHLVICLRGGFFPLDSPSENSHIGTSSRPGITCVVGHIKTPSDHHHPGSSDPSRVVFPVTFSAIKKGHLKDLHLGWFKRRRIPGSWRIFHKKKQFWRIFWKKKSRILRGVVQKKSIPTPILLGYPFGTEVDGSLGDRINGWVISPQPQGISH